jgi:uncharacterized tellurite resistance protein B-like protein
VTENVATCLVVAKVLVADGMMTDEAREFLGGLMTSLGLSEAERTSVIELEDLDAAEPVVRRLPEERRRDILAMLVDAASADGKLSPHELATIHRVEAALGLRP